MLRRGSHGDATLTAPDAEGLALALMRYYGLLRTAPPWRLCWSRSVSAFGQCLPARREIRLSRRLVERNPPWAVLDCILHEIAHALAPRAGHGEAWRRTAIKIGCDARRCYGPDEIVTMPRRYLYTCGCGRFYPRHRRTLERRRCGVCGQAFSRR